MNLSKSLPTVTIIIITWNVERTIQKVLDSIREQDYPKKLIDIIAVDGNSTDNTEKIIKSFEIVANFFRGSNAHSSKILPLVA